MTALLHADGPGGNDDVPAGDVPAMSNMPTNVFLSILLCDNFGGYLGLICLFSCFFSVVFDSSLDEVKEEGVGVENAKDVRIGTQAGQEPGGRS